MLGLTVPAWAQEPPSPPDSSPGEIVVQHTRPQDVSPAEVHRQARAVAASSDHLRVPLARFEDRLCAGIVGLQADAAMLMIDRIRDNAHQLGIRLHEDGCQPNFVVIFSDDSQVTMRSVVDRNPAIFQFVPPAERRRLLAPAPVHVFSHVEPRTRDGMPIARERNLVSPPVSRQQMAHSLIYTTTRRDITSVTIVFDSREVVGMSVGQLADYATMRGLAETQVPGEVPLNSILTLFNPEGPYPESLTEFDRAYLRALYDWVPNLPAAAKLGSVTRELERLRVERAAEAGAAPSEQ
ncbi:hypothetical protein [Alteraurantiacibacter palmitatis]|uniref:hypothetical protein n=1 Tax=Alteraurantiacibacter palmitatis TaxID=2054628 RepID=UPI0036720AA8